MLTIGIKLPWQLVCDPVQRDIRLGPAQLVERHLGGLGISAHSGGDGQHAVGTRQVAAVTDRFARQRDRLIELGEAFGLHHLDFVLQDFHLLYALAGFARVGEIDLLLQHKALKLGLLSRMAERVTFVLIPPLGLIFLVLGTIFLGIATPTEGGAMGAVGALAMALARRRIDLKLLRQAMDSTMKLSCFVLFILIGATVFGYYMTLSRIPQEVVTAVSAMDLNRWVVIIGIVGGYMFSVFVQDVNPGAFAAGITLLTGVPEVIISCVKALLFGLIAGLVACYRGLTVSGGGAKAVGNAVNETVVFAFMALLVVNVVVTAIGIRMSVK